MPGTETEIMRICCKIIARKGDSHRCLPWMAAACAGLLLCFLSFPVVAVAKEFERPIRIGVLTTSWGPTPHVVGLRDGLAELGYVEDRDFILGIRFTQGDVAALSQAARDLANFGVDLLFCVNESPVKAAMEATSRIPIVFTGAADPVGKGLIRSFAHPGGNVTGVTDLDVKLGGRRLQMFLEIVPTLKRVLFVYDASHSARLSLERAYRTAANKLGITLISKGVNTESEARKALLSFDKGTIDGILSPGVSDLNLIGLMQESTGKNKIPTMFIAPFNVENGGFAGYGPSMFEAGRQSARLMDKIIRGEDPGKIPVEVNDRVQLVINLKVARKLGIEIPPEILYRADRIIR